MSFLNPRDYYFELNRGKFSPNEAGQNFNGFSLTNTNGVATDLWGDPGVANLVWQTAAVNVEVLSTSANDTAAAGTKARAIQVFGVDFNLAPVSEVVLLNGVAPVALVNQYFRINRGFVVDYGTFGVRNEGNITFRVAGGGATLAYIPAEFGRVPMTHFTVPAGKVLIPRSFAFNAESGKPSSCEFRIQTSKAGLIPPFTGYGPAQRALTVYGVEGWIDRRFEYQTPLPAGMDFWMLGIPGANNTRMYGEWNGVLIDA